MNEYEKRIDKLFELFDESIRNFNELKIVTKKSMELCEQSIVIIKELLKENERLVSEKPCQ